MHRLIIVLPHNIVLNDESKRLKLHKIISNWLNKVNEAEISEKVSKNGCIIDRVRAEERGITQKTVHG